MNERQQIHIESIDSGRLAALAYATIDLYRRVISTPEGKEMLEHKKDELRAKGII